MPPDRLPLELRVGLRTGSVFYFVARELYSEVPHFFVVLNRDPLGDQLLLMTVFTSKVDKVRMRNRETPECVVEFGPQDYSPLTEPTAIDANFIVRRNLAEMADYVRRGVVSYHDDLPVDLLEMIREGVSASPQVSEEDKELIR